MRLEDLTGYLDDYLEVAECPDYDTAFNGLQVEGKPDVHRVAVAVDACQATIHGAIERGADMLLAHHGLLWTHGPYTGPRYRRLAALVRADMSVYACHLPLDVHPEVGNNHVLARGLGLEVVGAFAEYRGRSIGLICKCVLGLAELGNRASALLGSPPRVLAHGPTLVRNVAVLTGGGGSYALEAARCGCDTLITGEGPHHVYFDAEENGLNLVLGGHYATETLGVRALADHLHARFGLAAAFIDHPTGL